MKYEVNGHGLCLIMFFSLSAVITIAGLMKIGEWVNEIARSVAR